jgi:integrase
MDELRNSVTYFILNSDLEPSTKDDYIKNRYLNFTKEINEETAKEFLSQFNNVNSYNNALKSIRYLFRFLNLPLNIKQKKYNVDRLIIAPKVEEVERFLRLLYEYLPSKDFNIVVYFSICATTALRPYKILSLTWDEIQGNFIIPKKQNVRTKHYRPNPIHPKVKILLERLPKTNERIFPFTEHKVRLVKKRVEYYIQPSRLRDFFYNTARKVMDKDLVEWLMGHRLGIKEHYLADEVLEQYQNFVRVFPMEWVE